MSDINFNGGKAINLGDAKFEQDGVNLRTLRRFSSVLTANTVSAMVSGITAGNNIAISGTTSAITISLSGNITTNSVNSGTFLSAGTDLYSIFLTTADGNDITRVQPGSNITTGGTANNPIINIVSSPSFSNFNFSGTGNGSSLFVSTLSGGSIFSGSSNLSNLFISTAATNVYTLGQGTNIVTGGTANNPNVSVVDSPSFNGFSFSGIASGDSFSATSLSGGTIFSGNTDLYNIFAPFGSSGGVDNVLPGTNIATGGTVTSPTINVVDSPSFNGFSFSGIASGDSFSATSLSGGTVFSGNTNLYDIFQTQNYFTTGSTFNAGNGTISFDRNDIANAYSVNIDGRYLSISGGTITGNTLFTNNLSATTFYSGGTDISLLFGQGGGGGFSGWTASTGLNSIVANNGTNNEATGDTSFVFGTSSRANNINTNVFGAYITGNTRDTTYVDRFNIKNLSGGSSINTLGIDANGFIVTATTGTAGAFLNLSGGTITGDTIFTEGLTATTFSSNTLTASNISATTLYANIITANTISATTYYNIPTSFGSGANNNGGTILTGVTGYLTMGNSGRIIGWDLLGAPSGNCVMDIWKTSLNALPTVANSITSTNKPTITSAVYSGSTTLTNWTGLTYSAGDKFGFNIDSVSGFTVLTLTVRALKEG